MAQAINFYRTDDEYGCFSNFAPYPIELKGRKFSCTEHEEAIRSVKSPMTAARMGRDRRRSLRPDWETVKDGVMRETVRAKFRQHPEPCETLFETSYAIIVEHTERDSYWGDGGDGSGKNMLGRTIMEIRQELQDMSL